jgi:hypothetical protein
VTVDEGGPYFSTRDDVGQKRKKFYLVEREDGGCKMKTDSMFLGRKRVLRIQTFFQAVHKELNGGENNEQ